MQLAEKTRRFALTLLVSSSPLAFAQPMPGALPAQPMTNAPLADQTVGATPVPTESLASKARNIAIGTEGGEAHATMKELVSLQQEQYLYELRNKMKVGSSGGAMLPPAPGALPFPLPQGTMPTIPNAIPAPQAPVPEVDPTPDAKVMSIIVSSGRGRADILKGSVVTTVKEGDKIDQWEVTAIRLDGVTVETTVSEKRAAPVSRSRRTAGQEPVIRDKVIVAKLQMAPADAIGNAALSPAPAASPAVVPPLPAPIRPVDSTSIPAPRPLN